MKVNWREKWATAWRDPVGSKLIANLIWAALVAIALLILAVGQGWIFKRTPEPAASPVAGPLTPEPAPAGNPPKDSPAPQQPPPGLTRSGETPTAHVRPKAEPAPPVVPPEPKPEPPAPTPAVFIDCRIGTLPKTVPASGRIYALVPQPLPQASGGGGLIEYFGQPGTEWNWGKVPDFVYRCEAINCATSLLIDVDMDFAYEMRRPIPVPDQPKALKQGEVTLSRTWPIEIAKIDVGTGNPFVFYLHNCCQDRFVYFRAPATARGTLNGSQVELRVQQSENNLSQPLLPHRPDEK